MAVGSAVSLPTSCELCPRRCGVNRAAGERGVCGAGSELRVARAALHAWEEPVVSVGAGSGTVFFSGCPLRCVYCQNAEISTGFAGFDISLERLVEIFLELHSQKNRAWLEDLAGSLATAPLPPAEFARIWAETTDRHGSFLRYQDIVISIIESNVTLERLTEFKRAFAQMLAPVIDVLARQCGCSTSAAQDLYLRLLYQAPGLYNHHHCADLTREAMKAAGMPETTGNFVDDYADFVELCVSRASKQG